MATLIEDRVAHRAAPAPGVRGSRPLKAVALTAIVALVVGFGIGWIVFRDSGSDVPADVEELIDAYEAAWNELDSDAVAGLMAPGARHYSLGAGASYWPDGATAEELATAFRGGTPDGIDLEIQRVHGDGPYLVVSVGTAYGDDGFSVTHVEEIGGELLIADHVWTG